MRRSALLLAFFPALALACPAIRAQRVSGQNDLQLNQAKAIVATFVDRLHRTLSFEAASDGLLIFTPVTREESLRDLDRGTFPEVDKGIEPALLGLSLLGQQFARSVDDARLRKLSFAYWDILYLSVLGGVPDCADPDAENAKEICPLMRRWKRHQKINSDVALDDALKTTQELCAAIRKRLPPDPFQSEVYKNGLQNVEKYHSAIAQRLEPSTLNGRAPWKDIFLVPQEGFDFLVVLDAGQPKIWKIAVPWMD